jgi:hypothetical protein
MEVAESAWTNLNLEELKEYGRILDHRPASLHGNTVGMNLATQWLRVRTRAGSVAPLRANLVQKEFEIRRGTCNIVLKARQMGLTTWAAARFSSKRSPIPER